MVSRDTVLAEVNPAEAPLISACLRGTPTGSGQALQRRMSGTSTLPIASISSVPGGRWCASACF